MQYSIAYQMSRQTMSVQDHLSWHM